MRVVLAEDLHLLRDGLVLLLEAHGFEIAAAVDNGPDLRHALTWHRPDVAVLKAARMQRPHLRRRVSAS